MLHFQPGVTDARETVWWEIVSSFRRVEPEPD